MEVTVRIELLLLPDVNKTLRGLSVAERPGTEGTEAVRLTVPLSPVLVKTTREEPEVPAVIDIGLEEMVKSNTLTVTVVLWDKVPLLAVAVAVDNPATRELQDKVELPEEPSLMVPGARVQERPVAVVTLRVRVSLPVKPFRLVRLIFEELVAPTLILTKVGPAAMEKSCTLKVTGSWWNKEPLVPLTVTV